MNLYKIKLLIFIQENLLKMYTHYRNYITHNYSFIYIYLHVI